MGILPQKQQGNQWGILTDYDVRNNLIDITAFGDAQRTYIPSLGQVRFSGIAPATPEVLAVMQRWISNGTPRFPVYAEEWMCLYCASPNPLPSTHCGKCGAPRNWLIG